MNPFSFFERLARSSLKVVGIITLFVLLIPALFFVGIKFDFSTNEDIYHHDIGWFMILPLLGIVCLVIGLRKLSAWTRSRDKENAVQPNPTSLPFELLSVIEQNPHINIQELEGLTGATAEYLQPNLRTLILDKKIKQSLEGGIAYYTAF
jgi:predicted transcriptional regulator